MHIVAPTLPASHRGRPLACRQALDEPFRRIAAAEPGRAWTGDESAVWPLRKAARRAGWEIDEIDGALARLAETVWEERGRG